MKCTESLSDLQPLRQPVRRAIRPKAELLPLSSGGPRRGGGGDKQEESKAAVREEPTECRASERQESHPELELCELHRRSTLPLLVLPPFTSTSSRPCAPEQRPLRCTRVPPGDCQADPPAQSQLLPLRSPASQPQPYPIRLILRATRSRFI